MIRRYNSASGYQHMIDDCLLTQLKSGVVETAVVSAFHLSEVTGQNGAALSTFSK